VVSAAGLDAAQGYVYDHDSNRVAAATGSASVSYAYDRTGQLLSLDDEGHDPELFAYDAWGNLTSSATDFDTLTAYAYDAADRLTAITQPDATQTSFGFDALGRHASSTTGSVVTTFAYLGTSETAWQLDDGTTTVNATLDADGSRLAIEADGTDGFTLADLHGNTAAAVNAADDTILSAVRYDAYGQTADSHDSGGGFPSPWGFQGRLDLSADAANPLYEFSARFYAPALGAFTQLDSYPGEAASVLSLNRYLYAGANPWTLSDPTGHAFEAGAGADGGSGCRGCKPVKPKPPQLPQTPGPLPQGPAREEDKPAGSPDPAPAPAALPRQLTPCQSTEPCVNLDGAIAVLGAVFVVSGGVVLAPVAASVAAEGAAYVGAGGLYGICVWACQKAVGVGGAIAESFAGAPPGAISPMAMQMAGVAATKAEARLMLDSLGPLAVQSASARRTISAATATSTIVVGRTGDSIVVQIYRPGHDGYQIIQQVVATDGSRSVVQFAYDAQGALTHYDPKFEFIR
jgi:RHS repeat-associated protein